MEFSVIIPACQEQNYIEKTLKSVPKNIEKIVVANGCTDNTAKLARKYAKVIEIKKRNVSLARNLGAKKAKGDILIFLDADTLLKKDALNEIEISLRTSDFGICKFGPDIKKPKYIMIKVLRDLFEITKLPFMITMAYSSGVIYCKKNLFKKISGFNEDLKLGEDRDFLLKSKKHGKFSIAKTRSITSMRRFEKIGVLNRARFGIIEFFKNKKDNYPLIR